MSESREKIVDFYDYCWRCEHLNVNPEKYPCDECVAHPVNLDTHKPVKFEERKAVEK